MQNNIANNVTYEEYSAECKQYELYIEDDDYEAFIAAIRTNIPRTDTVFEKAFMHSKAWADALIHTGYNVKEHVGLLYEAVGNRNSSLVEYLLIHGADPNEVVESDFSAMSRISGFKENGEEWEKIVRLLLEYGGDPVAGGYNYVSVAGSILHSGTEGLKRFYVDLLDTKALLTKIDSYGKSIIDVPCDADTARYILQKLPKCKPYIDWEMKWNIEFIKSIPIRIENNELYVANKKHRKLIVERIESLIDDYYMQVVFDKKALIFEQVTELIVGLEKIQEDYKFDLQENIDFLLDYQRDVQG